MEDTSNSFVQHAQEVVKKNSANIKQWEFSETEANMARNDPKCQNYRKAWEHNEKIFVEFELRCSQQSWNVR